MKHYNIFFLLLFISGYSCKVKAGEVELQPIYSKKIQKTVSQKLIPTTTTTTTTQTFDQLVESIDAAINAKYSQKSQIKDFFSTVQLKDDRAIVILSMLSLHCQDEQSTEKLMLALYDKNQFFKKSVDIFMQEADLNIKTVTCHTLEAVENSEYMQPRHILNLLPFLLKKFFLNNALSKINYNYFLQFPNSSKVFWFDVCPVTHRLVTVCQDKTINLWDLKNNKSIAHYTLNKGYAGCVCFNKEGTHFATLETYKRGTSYIRQWKINFVGFEQTHVKKVQALIKLILYCGKSLIATNSGFYNSDYGRTEYDQYSITFKKDGHVLLQGPALLLYSLTRKGLLNFSDEDYFPVMNKAPYEAQIKQNEPTVVKVTKYHCQDLYLCTQAISNSQAVEDLRRIEASQSYHQLTPYEKEVIKERIAKRIAELKLQNK